MTEPEMLGTEREARALEMMKEANRIAREIELPRGIKFTGSLPANQTVRVRAGKWNVGSVINLRSITEKAMRRALDIGIYKLGKDQVFHLSHVIHGASGRQWKKYKRYRRLQGDPI